MTFFGFNKQLDLQTLVTQIGRYFAMSGGWYDQRQSVQVIFILILLSTSIIAAFVLFSTFRRLALEIRLASLGLWFMAMFIVIRAASFHHVDRFLGQSLIGVRWNFVLEIGSIILVAASGLWYLQKVRPADSAD